MPGAAIVERAIRSLKEACPGAAIFVSDESAGSAATVLKEKGLVEQLRAVARATLSDEQDSIALCFDYYAFLDPTLYVEARRRHFEFLAQYSYSENVPPGFLPDLISKELIEQLPEELNEDLRSFVFRNIDRYDAELLYFDPDLRQHRLNLSGATGRSRALVESVLQHNPELRYSQLQEFVSAHPESLRPYPSCIEVELTSRSPVTPVYWPGAKSARNADLPSDLLEGLLEDVEKNAFYRDVSFIFGGLGEPLLYDALDDVLERVLGLPAVRQVYVETFASGLSSGRVQAWDGLGGSDRLNVIVRLNTLDRKRYASLHGADMLPAVMEHVEGLKNGTYRLKLFAEMLRIKDTDDEVGAFFDYFEKSALTPILQKFNTYLGAVEQRRVADLTPLHRDFCWHLARDLYITADGRSPVCKQDPFAERSGLDLREHSIEAIWTAGQKNHAASVRGEHEVISMPCLQCDEWYTFNA